MSSTLERILADTEVPDLLEILSERLSPTDLQSLMLAVYARRSAARSPADVLADYERSRFFGAAPFARADYAAWEHVADAVMADRFEVLALSPVAPLASCAAVATVGQGWSVPTVRTGEVVSDSTNILALEAALRRRRRPSDRALVHLATTQRVVRPQAYADPGMLAHFALMALVSTGRDHGSHSIEAEAVGLHLDTHLAAFSRLFGAGVRLSVGYTIVSNSHDDARRNAVMAAATRHGVAVAEEPGREAAHGYYAGFCFHIWGEIGGERYQLSDGGAVDWVGRLLSNAKERTLISGCGVEGALAMRARMQGETAA
ncbi:hypothetical protein [Kaistia granuli]|uniref:hypothetical protein n=1 Tax=Kaistia granuli TaxID=363259 RepID=UPI00036B91FD|nr:hypothetical protein [Kaistia granuli]